MYGMPESAAVPHQEMRRMAELVGVPIPAGKRNDQRKRDEIMSEILDSSERREFDTGAVRDMSAGKGRCDLMPLAEIATTFNDVIICEIASFTQTQSVVYLHNAIRVFVSVYYPSEEDAMLDLAKHYENGLKKYPENNWKKGIPVSSFIDSGVRHYYKAKRGDDDENHRAAFMWNMYGCIWTVLHDGGDMTKYTEHKHED